ncbi:MAG: glucosidase, partial [Bacteroidota bacterium]
VDISFGIFDIDIKIVPISVHNRSVRDHPIHVLPHVWFRNFWKHNPRYDRPEISVVDEGLLMTKSIRNGRYYIYHDGGTPLFCENETNNERIYNFPNDTAYVKDGINDHVLHQASTINPEKIGSKAAIWYRDIIPGGGHREYRLRLTKRKKKDPWARFESHISRRAKEATHYYQTQFPAVSRPDHQHLLRSAMGGLMWTKQFYYLDVYKWLFGGPGEMPPQRNLRRNFDWQHLTNRNIISMPDKWEYPWYAAWDLAFHTTTFAEVDTDFAKGQLQLMLTEYYMHPNGQIPAYEWNFSDVNPPVHSWAVWQVFCRDRELSGEPDYQFLEVTFQKLLINFTWWVNQKDRDGNALFDGGFLGLDNIGVFDRNHLPPGIRSMQQADATSWMAMFALNMLRMSIELATQNPAYEESASKFFRHFLNIGWAMHNIGEGHISLWDDEDAFYYDVLQMDNGYTSRLKVRSLVGIIPLFAVDVIHSDLFDSLTEFKERAQRIIRTRPDLA